MKCLICAILGETGVARVTVAAVTDRSTLPFIPQKKKPIEISANYLTDNFLYSAVHKIPTPSSMASIWSIEDDRRFWGYALCAQSSGQGMGLVDSNGNKC